MFNLDKSIVVADQFASVIASIIYDTIVKFMYDNMTDFINMVVTLLMVKTPELDMVIIRKNAAAFFRFYMNSIKKENDSVFLKDRFDRKTGFDVLDIARMYEYGTATIPPKRVWRSLVDLHKKHSVQSEEVKLNNYFKQELAS